MLADLACRPFSSNHADWVNRIEMYNLILSYDQDYHLRTNRKAHGNARPPTYIVRICKVMACSNNIIMTTRGEQTSETMRWLRQSKGLVEISILSLE